MKIIFTVSVFILLITLSGCVYKFGGAEVYKATSKTEEGKEIVNKYNIKYVSSTTYSLYFLSIYRKKGAFAMNVVKKDGKISYDILEKEYVEKYKLKPRFSFIEKYGFIILIVLIPIIAKIILSDNKK